MAPLATSDPATIRMIPTPALQLARSPRNITASTMVTARLDVPIAVTGVAAPSERALKYATHEMAVANPDSARKSQALPLSVFVF